MRHGTELVNARNPFFRVKGRFTRYLAVCFCTGVIGFIAALLPLHSGLSPLASLVLSSLASGLCNYTALELWGFPHRKGRLSWRRLTHSSLVGVSGFLVRYGVLILGLRLWHGLAPFDKALSLAFAYGASFFVGYLLRSRLVFRKSATTRRFAK